MKEDKQLFDTRRLFNEIKLIIKDEEHCVSVGAISSAYISMFAIYPSFKEAKKHFEKSNKELLDSMKNWFNSEETEFSSSISIPADLKNLFG